MRERSDWTRNRKAVAVDGGHEACQADSDFEIDFFENELSLPLESQALSFSIASSTVFRTRLNNFLPEFIFFSFIFPFSYVL